MVESHPQQTEVSRLPHPSARATLLRAAGIGLPILVVFGAAGYAYVQNEESKLVTESHFSKTAACGVEEVDQSSTTSRSFELIAKADGQSEISQDLTISRMSNGSYRYTTVDARGKSKVTPASGTVQSEANRDIRLVSVEDKKLSWDIDIIPGWPARAGFGVDISPVC